jgi:histidine ammonia-lyase
MAYKTLRARNGESEMAVIINGRDLTIEEVIRVCRNYEKVEIADEAKEAINKARAYVEKKVAEKAVVYGLTTGFGKFANVSISTEETAQLQKNLIMSHTCSLGNN